MKMKVFRRFALREPRRCTWAFAIILMLSATSATAQTGSNEPQRIVVKRDASYEDLPQVVRRRPSPALSESDRQEFMSAQPQLILDGAVLDITPPQVGSTQTLSVSRLELRQGARLVTHGVNLEINSTLIASDASSMIIAFPARRGDFTAPLGTNGRSGLDGGTLILNGEIKRDDTLQVRLDGEPGQAGGPGLQGGGGAAGTRGDDGADHLFDCAHGGGNGGNGGKGGSGGQGARGGAGGSGGRLVLRGAAVEQRLQIVFSAHGGPGGAGGMGGLGGPGGPGGAGGHGSTYCRGGSGGSNGPAGDPGQPGVQGENGREGAILAD
jgi:hypothetical protein